MTALAGFRIAVNESLAGMKRAVRQGDTVHVSPAMWALMKDATQDELRHLLANIPLVVVPTPDEWLARLEGRAVPTPEEAMEERLRLLAKHLPTQPKA